MAKNPKLDDPNLSMFDIMADIIKHKRGDLDQHEEFDNVYSKFLMNRYFSMDERFAETNSLLLRDGAALDNRGHYKLFVAMMPKCNNAFIKYLKKSKPKTKKKKG